MNSSDIIAIIAIIVSILTSLLLAPIWKAISQKKFRTIRDKIKSNRGALRKPAIKFLQSVLNKYHFDYPVEEALGIKPQEGYLIRLGKDIPLLNINDVTLEMVPVEEPTIIAQKQKQASRILPAESLFKHFETMAESIREIEKPDPERFDPRCVYRFLSFDYQNNNLILRFDQSRDFTYFHQINFNNLLEYELARKYFRKAGKKISDLPFRRYVTKSLIIGDFRQFKDLTLFAGISTLTMLRMNDRFRILMHNRINTATVPETNHVVPAGEFQPINSDPSIFDKDFKLWYSILREYSEEIQRNKEAKGENAGSFTYEEEEFDVITKAIPEEDRYVLGFGLDPITFKVEILTCIVVDFENFIKTLPGETRESKMAFYYSLKDYEPKRDEGKFFWHGNEIGIAYEDIGKFIDDPKTLNAARTALSILRDNYPTFKSKYLRPKSQPTGNS